MPMTDNNILLVKSGEPRSELQQAYDQIALLEAKIENLELENGNMRCIIAGLKMDNKRMRSALYD